MCRNPLTCPRVVVDTNPACGVRNGHEWVEDYARSSHSLGPVYRRGTVFRVHHSNSVKIHAFAIQNSKIDKNRAFFHIILNAQYIDKVRYRPYFGKVRYSSWYSVRNMAASSIFVPKG